MHKQLKWLFAMVAVTLITAGCGKDSTGELGTPATASFTMTPIAGRANTFLLQSTSENAFGYSWDKGNGSFVKGKAIDTAYFPLKGTYTVRLRAFGRGGYGAAEESVTIDTDDIQNNPQFQLLVGKTWKLDATPGANAIIVGTENNPGEYFGGGGLDGCQTDDEYIFSPQFQLTYDANGATFNGANIAPNFNCGTDRSYVATFTFTPGTTAGQGLATITLPGAVPNQFIGVTDISSNNYRIISISQTAMVLRSGTASQTVHQFKFVSN